MSDLIKLLVATPLCAAGVPLKDLPSAPLVRSRDPPLSRKYPAQPLHPLAVMKGGVNNSPGLRSEKASGAQRGSRFWFQAALSAGRQLGD